MNFDLDTSKRIQAASIADPVASATSLAVSALIHPQQEQLFTILKAKFKEVPFQGIQDEEVVSLARQRLLNYVEQAELIYNDLRLGST